MTATPQTPKILDPNGDDAATLHSWSDRDPATIVKRTARTIVVQRDRTQQMSSNDHVQSNLAYARGHGDVVVFIRDYDAPLETYTLRSNGRYVRKGASMRERGASLSIGTRSVYRDPSF